ncbi:carbamoyltransferase [Prochlorococcus marinus XMU1412]|uniref:carbamoyltransferase family protein n=1 Tax=Prochlorococcus marinus TaxID=1219 RepID=UPI001ADBE6B5|nr:carbamoyltransferase [Prochlorococcus marinus]MBO8240553.1 carbamoyltransferase [Prochlorococcus marinus XMU1412]MBW3071788.1 hypothetical protein [Prochlorococcus marinus str. MU1412]
MAVIGISCFYHDSAAALISDDGEIIAAVQEERFSRKKNDSRFPFCSVDYCYKIALEKKIEVKAYIYYEKPIRVFMRLLETYFNTAPRGISSFLPAMQTWIKEKLFIKDNIIAELKLIDESIIPEKLYFSEHHLSHAAAAFYPSPFEDAAILCMDAVGEWVTTSAWLGDKENIKPLWEINFPDSLGMLYSSFTYYCGFKVNSGEYKLMGLAPYGNPVYKDLILNNLIEIRDDGSFKLNMKYFKYHRGLKMISSAFIKLFGKPPRNPKDEITQFYMDMASSIQKVLEIAVLRIAKNLQKKTQKKYLCLAGGVALNCVANGKILDKSGFEKIWIQPAAGDAGSAVGCALSYIYKHTKQVRQINKNDSMKSSYLGPEFDNKIIQKYLDKLGIKYHKLEDTLLIKKVSDYLIKGKIIGWFQGKMEYGPRALCNRSIIADPRIKNMQQRMNLKIKFRESFRPFAPAILEEDKEEFFGIKDESPYMLLTRKLNSKFLKEKKSESTYKGTDRVNEIRSTLPAITHIDNSCRIQTISKERNPLFYLLLSEFKNQTGSPVLINTSFNVRGEPIICTPEDALRCFSFTNMDLLAIGNFLIVKSELDSDISKFFLKPYLIED